MHYIILQHPGHNRVYFNTADILALAELRIALKKQAITSEVPSIIILEDIRYISFKTEIALTESDLKLVSRLSFVFALFIMEKQQDTTFLRPLKMDRHEYMDNKISALLKYQGKTNELFTKMMLNVALLSSGFDASENIQLLDPVAGKGTSLFEATVYGYDAYGIEIEPKPVQEAALFFKKYLEKERLKHRRVQRQLYGSNKTEAITIQEFTYAKNKDAFKKEEGLKSLGFVNGNARDAFNYFKKERFHLIVGDLPYGISHGHSASSTYSSKTRNPSAFLEECLPHWYRTLKTKGCIVMAWNAFTIPRTQLAVLFTANGFDVLSEAPYDSFEHRVDQSIKRDIIVAIKK